MPCYGKSKAALHQLRSKIIDWTKEQLKAINSDGSIIVSAAAGAGKTAVLTERIARIVESGVPITEMLVVTFTEAAAAEMKRRIEKALYVRAESAENADLRHYLYNQAQSVSRASISTLHAFCLRVLKKHFFEVDLSPSFRTADTVERKQLITAALNEVAERFFDDCKDDRERTVAIISMFGNEEKLFKAIQEIHAFMQTLPNSKEWLDSVEAAYTHELTEQELEREPYINDLVTYCRERIGDALTLTLAAREKASFYPAVCAVLDSNAAMLRAALTKNDYAGLSRFMNDLTLEDFRGIRGKKAIDDDTLKAEVSTLKNKAAKLTAKAAGYVTRPLAEIAAVQSSLSLVVRDLVLLLRSFDETFSAMKRDSSVVDFSDMEQLAYSLLKNPEIAASYGAAFKHIFVDEYQDINRLQNSIIHSISASSELFFVGDVKQSIYRFRNADPTLFMAKLLEFMSDSHTQRMDLNANFRSSSAVIDFSNMVFESIMSKRTGEMDYDDKNRLIKLRLDTEGIEDVCGSVEINFIDSCKSSTDTTDDLETLLTLEAEATLAASRIRDMMDSGSIYDSKEGKVRPYRYSDFAIIVRSAVKCAETFTRIFALCGVPLYAESKGGYFEALEVSIFLNLLRVLDNRRQDIPLLSVMRSCIGGFSVAELAQLRHEADSADGSLSKADVFECVACVSKLNTPLGKKCFEFIAKLNEWSILSKLISVEELIAHLFDKTGYYRYVAALPGGKTRVLNLDLLLNVARSFESNMGNGLYGFTRYVEDAGLHSDNSEASACPADVVRLITIHKSKGLEFNVVIVPNLSRSIISEPPSKSAVLTDPNLGLGIEFSDSMGVKHHSSLFTALSESKKRSMMADELRLLYVAFTRAREKLILIVSTNDLNKEADEAALMSSYIELAATESKTYVQWLLLALQRSKEHRSMLCSALINGHASMRGFCIKVYPHTGFALAEGDGKRKQLSELEEKLAMVDYSDFDAKQRTEYPFKAACVIPSKCSPSSIEEHTVYLREFRSSGLSRESLPLTPLERGTAYHTVMQHIPLALHTPETVSAAIEGLIKRGLLTEREAQVVKPADIAAFFSGEIGSLLVAHSQSVLRETEFNCEMPARLLFDTKADDTVMVQGVIDCCFLYEGEYVIVDYKTDTVHRGTDPQEVACRHATQLAIYKEALQRLTGTKVSSCYIHIFGAGDFCVIKNAP